MTLYKKHLSEDQLSQDFPLEAVGTAFSFESPFCPSPAMGLMLPSLLSASIASPHHPRQCHWLNLCIYSPLKPPYPLSQRGQGDPCPEDCIRLGAGKGCYPAGSSHE